MGSCRLGSISTTCRGWIFPVLAPADGEIAQILQRTGRRSRPTSLVAVTLQPISLRDGLISR